MSNEIIICTLGYEDSLCREETCSDPKKLCFTSAIDIAI